ncbi:MAG: glycosyltransferase family 4 protein [Opitutaceae bacterium]|nr:glycosyltransferase family 4 protein [Opitutaceae bacterium]MBP9911805.1 glycosyltransferase family 4 protein [Opitutaceae bacterium]
MKPVGRILFFNRFYWPEEPATAQLLTDLAEALAAKGLAVAVLTSAPHARSLAKSEIHRGVSIYRVRTPRLGGRTAFAKAVNWLLFSGAALWWLLWNLRREDTLILLTDPPLLAVLAAPVARFRGARLFHWVQDVFPELATVLGGVRGLGWLRALRNRAWRQAEGCVTLGKDMALLLAAQGVASQRIHVVPNWAPRGLAPAPASEIETLRCQRGLAGKFVVSYSGNLGRVHDIEPVITLAAALRQEPDIVFIFIGDGAQRPRLTQLCQTAGLTNVRFLPHQPREQLAASLGAGDVHLVTLRVGCEQLVLPSKFYGILAVGRPVLFIGPDCDLARQIDSAGIGQACRRVDITRMRQLLSDWRTHPEQMAAMNQHALACSQATGGVATAASTWYSLLASPKSQSSLS